MNPVLGKDLSRILNDPRKEIQLARNPLARLYRKILMDLQIKPDTMNDNMLRWLDDPHNGIPNNGATRSSERGNLIKEMTRANMTWRVFMKCIRFLRPLNIKLTVELEWPGHRKTQHELFVKVSHADAVASGEDE